MITLIKRTIAYYLKSSKEFLFLLTFPIIIITAEYMMMEKVFNQENFNPFEGENLYYTVENNEDGIISEVELKALIEGMDLNVIKGESKNDEDVQINIKSNEVDIVYSSGNSQLASSIVEIMKNYDRSVRAYMMGGGSRVEEVDISTSFVKGEVIPSSKDYYGVSMITIFIISVGLMSVSQVTKELRTGLKIRLNTMGVSNSKYYTSTLIGYMIIAAVCLLPTYMYSYFILETNWGGNFLIPYLALIPFFILFISITMLASTLFKKGEQVISTIGGIMFPVLGMLGGCFFPLDMYLPEWFSVVSNISPLKWYNDGIFDMVYKNENTTLIIGSLAALIIGVALVFITINIADREARA
ncbi:MAG: ABC transporter permease [Clostridium sp.]